MADLGNQGETLRDLIARLIDSAKAYLWAEVALAKKTIKAIANQAVPIAALAGTALLLAIAGIVTIVAALGVALAPWLGVAGGLAAAGVLALLLAGLLVAFAIGRISRLRNTAKDMFKE